ncbi:hypothetical protein [uncultured Microbacterium sp.]|uniref:hypothetical protein n=1 Tax=uncultured Microbacterium sp. TaxID=191216 RepID=UPI0025DB2393|nr:hypothetical protein [uncultured Microbacterium sp.]
MVASAAVGVCDASASGATAGAATRGAAAFFVVVRGVAGFFVAPLAPAARGFAVPAVARGVVGFFAEPAARWVAGFFAAPAAPVAPAARGVVVRGARGLAAALGFVASVGAESAGVVASVDEGSAGVGSDPAEGAGFAAVVRGAGRFAAVVRGARGDRGAGGFATVASGSTLAAAPSVSDEDVSGSSGSDAVIAPNYQPPPTAPDPCGIGPGVPRR